MPSPFAYVALFAWIPITFVIYRRMRAPAATIWCVLCSGLFLPHAMAVDPPALPPLDKTSIAMLAALAACLWKARGRLWRAKPMRGLDLFFLVVVIGNVGTSITNPDHLISGPVIRPGLTLYDGFAMSVKDTLNLYLPFFLGRAMIRDQRDLRELARAMVVLGLVYSLLVLVEIRMSPQLHRWFYGFHQMTFGMTVRWGGYRPMIFMETGMAVAMFVLCTGIFAYARWKAKEGRIITGIWLSFILVICKSTGAIVYGIIAHPLTMVTKRPKLVLAAVLAGFTLFYPLLRSVDLVPVDEMVEYANQVNEERALSLWFRFDQEAQLLERARERFLFGWGGYDRNRIFDDISGIDLSVTDGDWAIQIGMRGIVGFIGVYGMMTLPLIFAPFRVSGIRDRRSRLLLGALALSAGVLIVDLIPNGLFNPFPLFFAGALHGLLGGLKQEQRRARKKTRRAGRERREAHKEPSDEEGSGPREIPV